MEFKGTKQPWIYFKDATGHSVFTERSLICRTNNKPSIEEADHNAQLIAAAPEMLNKLNEFLVMFSEYDMRPEDELHEYADSVRKLLDKALGYPDGKTY